MPYRFLEDTAIADVAFHAYAERLPELFVSAAMAVTSTMVGDPESLGHEVSRAFEIRSESVEMLLFHFLQEIIFYKDAELLLFNDYELDITQGDGGWHLSALIRGEEMDPARHELIADVKAVSLHRYEVKETPEGWQADVILDV